MIRVIVLAVSLLLAGQAFAQEDKAYVVFDAWATEDCTSETAIEFSFAQAVSVSNDGDIPCAAIEGLWVWNTLVASVDAYYRSNSFPAFRVRDDEKMGVYGTRDRVELPDRVIPARLTGRVSRCERLQGPDVMMVLGYCHYISGPFVALGDVEIRGETPPRLTGSEHRDRLGLLLPLDDGERDFVDSAVAKWLAIFLQNDPELYASVYEVGEHDQMDEPGTQFSILFHSTTSVFHRLRRSDATGFRAWKIKPDREGDEDLAVEQSALMVLVCFPLGDWSDDRWPVAVVDADNDNARPYACIIVGRGNWNSDVEEWVALPAQAQGLAEPAWD